ncbi:Uma2 family endonuclease, partial [Streptomyces alkaliphilus]|uniref:Uma2 family endonuclease n=1 Tax=Streptomyces alkaliphilus TaxID=1472722 RepID=UPI0034D2AC90
MELIDGETHVSPPPDGCHGETVAEVARGITLGAVDTRLRVYTGVGLRIPGRGRPDRFIPDVVVAPKGSFATSAEYHAPDAVVLVGEVTSSSTGERDRGAKQRGYARAGTPAYLLVDLTTAETILLSEPVGDEYRTHRRVPFADLLRMPPTRLRPRHRRLQSTGYFASPGGDAVFAVVRLCSPLPHTEPRPRTEPTPLSLGVVSPVQPFKDSFAALHVPLKNRRVCLGQFPVMVCGFGDDGQCFLVVFQVAQVDGEVVEAHGEVGEVSIGSGFGEGAADGDRLGNGLQHFLVVFQVAQVDGEVVEAHGEVGEVSIGSGFGEGAADGDRLGN